MAEAPVVRLPSGHEEEFAIEVEDDYQCLICHLPLKDPVLTRCGHRFCKECLEEHLRRQEVQSRPQTCPVDRKELNRDQDVFPDKATERKILSLAIKCPSECCSWIGELRSKETHLASCPLREVSCPNENCPVILKAKDLEEHLANECEWRIINCEFCGEQQTACHMQITGHTENHCLLTVVSCTFVHMGCDEKPLRRDLSSHLQSAMEEHLNFACAVVKQMQAQLNETQVELNKTEETTRNLEEKVRALEMNPQNENMRVLWKIDNFTQILRRAKARVRRKIAHAPFYTPNNGYKLKVSISPNGSLPNGWNTHLAVFFVVVKGGYDSALPWPFNKKVTFTLIDQQEDLSQRENVVREIIPENIYCFRRPTSEENYGCKISRYISHHELYTRNYLVDDTLFLQIDIGALR